MAEADSIENALVTKTRTIGVTFDRFNDINGVFGRQIRNEVRKQDGQNRADGQSGLVPGIPEIVLASHLAKVTLQTETGSSVRDRK